PAPSGRYAGIDVDIDGDARCQLFPTAGGDESSFGKSKPVVKIFYATPVYINAPVTFYNSAKDGEPKVHSWYVNGVMKSNEVNFMTTLTGPTDVVKLVSETCAGKDSFSVSVKVDTPTAVPVSDFISNKNLILQGESVIFTDLSNNGASTWKWEITPVQIFDDGSNVDRYKFTKGTATSQNPTVRFDYPGMYKVCLTGSNVLGAGNTECKVDYIEVMPVALMCDQSVVKDPRGNLYDDGGPNGPPMVNTSGGSPCKLLIDPCADTVYFVLDDFQTWCTMQYLRIYDGKDKTGKLLNGTMGSTQCSTNSGYYGGPGFTGGAGTCYAGTGLACVPTKGDTFIATSGKMYFEWDAYYPQYYSSTGFAGHWWSITKSQAAPVASFDVPDTVCTNAFLDFINTTTGDEVTYFWDLDGDLETFEYSGKDISYPMFVSGNNTFTLIAQNCGGVDTFQKVVYVQDPPIPTPEFFADNVKPTTNDVVFFTTDIIECVDDYKWVFTHQSSGSTAVSYVNGTSALAEAPAVIFPLSGCWNAKLIVENASGKDSIEKSCYLTVKDAYCIPSVSIMVPD
ncbi:MAG: hypothetical protein M3Q97_07385, partial [Bacteroidota bacterium]|nr:hypothetical protein [Bacteroidota bacterium]